MLCVIVYIAGTAKSVVKDNKRSLLDLPNLFSKNRFLLYGDFTDSYRKMLMRYITAYDG